MNQFHTTATVFLTLMTIASSSVAAFEKEKMVDKIAAIVGDQIILLSDVMKQAQAAINELERTSQNIGGGALVEGRIEGKIKEALDKMIDDEIYKIEAREMGLAVTTEEIDAAIENMARENNIDVPTLKQAIKSQGMDYLTYRNQLRNQLTRYKVLNLRVRSRIKISDTEARQHYNDQVRDIRATGSFEGAHLLIRVPASASAATAADARKRAEAALSRINEGEAFEVVAKEKSEDKATAKYGGHLGERNRGEIPAVLERAFFDLEVGEVAGPIRTPAGFHIIKLIRREALGVMPFSKVKNKIIQDLQEEEMQRQAGIWLKEQRARLFIDIRI
jgi:peptidyl-prolyl cis-trans isomerase SurA